MALSDAKRRLIGRLGARKTRAREELVLVEGVRAVAEALDASVDVRFAAVAPGLDALEGGPALRARLDGGGFPVEALSDRELADVSDTLTPQGVLLVCEQPIVALDALPTGPGRRYLLLDGVQDPGNVGTMIRTARAFALDGVVALDGSADPWGPKAVRASAGCCFHLPVTSARWAEAGAWTVAAGIHVLAGDGAGRDVSAVSAAGSWALAIGSEGAGVRPEILAVAESVAVPMQGGAESLNAAVAGAILLYALTRPGSV